MKVPLAYNPKTKILPRLDQDADLTSKVAITLALVLSLKFKTWHMILQEN